MKDLSEEHGLQLEIIDIRDNDALYKEFFIRIPLINIDGKIVFDATNVAQPDDYRTNLVRIVKSLN